MSKDTVACSSYKPLFSAPQWFISTKSYIEIGDLHFMGLFIPIMWVLLGFPIYLHQPLLFNDVQSVCVCVCVCKRPHVYWFTVFTVKAGSFKETQEDWLSHCSHRVTEIFHVTSYVQFPNPYDNHLPFSLVDLLNSFSIKLQCLTYKENWEVFPSFPAWRKFFFHVF